MFRRLVILSGLAGAGWYAYRKLTAAGTGSARADGPAGPVDHSAGGGLSERVTQAATAARQAATSAVSKARATAPKSGDAAADHAKTESSQPPPEVRAVADVVDAMPTVPPSTTLPKP